MHLLPSLLFAATEGAEGGTAVAPFDVATYQLLISLIPLLPILGFAFTALFGRRLMAKWGRGVAELFRCSPWSPSGSSRSR